MICKTDLLRSGEEVRVYLPDHSLPTNTPPRLAVLEFSSRKDLWETDEKAAFYLAKGYQFFSVTVRPVSTLKEAKKTTFAAWEYVKTYACENQTDCDLLFALTEGKDAIYGAAAGCYQDPDVTGLIFVCPDFSGSDFLPELLSGKTPPVFYLQETPTEADLSFGMCLSAAHILSAFHLAVPKDGERILTFLYRVRRIRGKALRPWA